MVLPAEELDEIAKKAIFNGFIQIDDLVYIMAEEECYSEILPRLWRFYECSIIHGTGRRKTDTYSDRARVWSIVLERMGRILGDKDSIWTEDSQEEFKAWLKDNLKPIRPLNIYRYSEAVGQPVNNFFERLESDCVKLEDLKEYIEDVEKVLKISFPLPRRLFPGPSKDEEVSLSNVFRKEGQFWTISYDGKTIRLKDAKGLWYINYLLQYPNRQFKAAELMKLFDAPPVTDVYNKMSDEELGKEGLSRSYSLGDAGNNIDSKAKSEYKRRLKEIQVEKAKAERENDFPVLNELKKEEEDLTKQLDAAYGLKGRPRRSSDYSEKIRKAVTNRIKAAQKDIEKEHPSLGKHLSNSIKKGSSCSYSPPEDISWDT